MFSRPQSGCDSDHSLVKKVTCLRSRIIIRDYNYAEVKAINVSRWEMFFSIFRENSERTTPPR